MYVILLNIFSLLILGCSQSYCLVLNLLKSGITLQNYQYHNIHFSSDFFPPKLPLRGSSNWYIRNSKQRWYLQIQRQNENVFLDIRVFIQGSMGAKCLGLKLVGKERRKEPFPLSIILFDDTSLISKMRRCHLLVQVPSFIQPCNP